MRTYFSKRQERALRERRLDCTLPKKLRISVLRLLEQHSDWGGWNDADNMTFEKTTSTLLTFYGQETLKAYDEKSELVPTDLKGLILNGWPGHVLDSVEAWFDNASATRARLLESELNSILRIHDSRWRFVDGSAFLIDSGYLRDEIIAPVLASLRSNNVAGALAEFNEAVQSMTRGESKDAVTNAHKSVESVMKAVLGRADGRFGQLIQEILKSQIVPEYYEEFLTHFEKILLAAGKERNLPGRGHGQGQKTIDVPPALAEFAVHLAAVVNLFILMRWTEIKPEDSK